MKHTLTIFTFYKTYYYLQKVLIYLTYSKKATYVDQSVSYMTKIH